MKTTLLKGLLGLAIMGVSASCTDGFGTGFESCKGKIALSTEVDASIKSARGSRSEYTEVKPSDLSITLTSADGKYTKTWGSVDDFDTSFEFNVGAYTIEATYGDENTEGFESPHFYGSSVIRVEENQTTTVSLKASVANAIVDVTYTDAFKAYMKAYRAEVHSAGGSYLTIAQDQTRPVYVKGGQTEVSVEFTKPNGNGAKLNVIDFTAEAGHFYHVSIDLTDGSGSTEAIKISLDEDLADADPITIDISDEVLNTAGPEITTKGFEPGESRTFVSGISTFSELCYNIIARGGLKNVKLTTRSASLLAQGWPAEVDLMNAGSDRAVLDQLGLTARGIFTNPDKLATIDLAAVANHIGYIAAGDNTTTFTLQVTDAYGKTSEAVSLNLICEKLNLQILDTDAYVGSPEFTVKFSYNGGNPKGNVNILYWSSDEGSYIDPEKVEYAPYKSSAQAISDKNSYLATVTISDTDGKIKLKFTAPGIEVIEKEVARQPRVTAAAAANAYAKSVYVPVTTGVADADASLPEMINKASLYLSTDDGTTFTKAETTPDATTKTLFVKGLEPGKTYTAKIRNAEENLDKAAPFTFTTEAEAQLPNGDCEAATTTPSKGSHWEQYDFPDGWGTNNPMTTSQGGDYGYTRISGTKPSTGSNGNGIQIRTNGWGSGNTAISGVNGKCKYIDAGLYHLGANRSVRPFGYSDVSGSFNTDDLNCGIAFASRPSSISFAYKYEAKNSADHGEVFVCVYDASNNILAQAKSNISAQSNFSTMKLDLNYTNPALTAKAAKIYVRFLSTNVSNALTKDGNWLNGPGFANVTRGEYSGSTLTIDDIELSY